MAKTATNIYKRKDGRWEGRYKKGYRDDGKASYGYIYGKCFNEVYDRLRELEMESPKAIKSKADATFKRIGDMWLSKIRLQVKTSTCSQYHYILKGSIYPALGGVKLKRLSQSDIEAFTQEKLGYSNQSGENLSAKSVRDMLAIIKSILDFAFERGYIENPITVTFPKVAKKEMRVLTQMEQDALESMLVDDCFNRYKLGILICLYTGLRLGEICALQWGDIDFQSRTLYVRRTVQRIKSSAKGEKKTSILIGTPKTDNSIRQIPLPEFLVRLLEDFKKADDCYVLTSIRLQPMDSRTLQNHFKSLMAQAGIKSINFHALRHTFATRCIEAGVDAKTLSEILGHSNVNITLSRYVHSSMEQKRASMDKLAEYLKQ